MICLSNWCEQIETKLRDTDGVEGTQQLISSVIGNYVTYHVMKSSEQMWILDDFDHVRHSEYTYHTHDTIYLSNDRTCSL